MNITGIDSQFLLNQSLPLNPSSLGAGADNSFAQMLERAASSATAAVSEADADSMMQSARTLSGGPAVIDRNSKLFEMCQEFETFLLKKPNHKHEGHSAEVRAD